MPGLWTSATEGAKFWLQMLTEIRNGGVQDVLITCVDGLKRFREAIQCSTQINAPGLAPRHDV